MSRSFVVVLALLIAASFGCRAAPDSATRSPSIAEAGERARPPAPPRAQAEARESGLFAHTSPGELPRIVVADERGRAHELPLRHTDVDARVRGHVAEVRVRQTFTNDLREPIEVSYRFPLPENAAVDGLRMIIGERVIDSEVQTRARARQTYDSAKASGQTAALLEQDRPNVFTQSVANIPPDATIEVELRYLQTLTQDGGSYEFVFPMVVGPRFVPPGSPPADALLSPPILGRGQRTGHDISLTLAVEAGLALSRWDAPTHTVVGSSTAQGFAVRLADAQTIPNRDFLIRWDAAAAQARATLHLGPADANGVGHFSLVVDPPRLDVDALVGRREFIFVVDRSGSMSGVPLALAKQTLRAALQGLRPVDSFDVIAFAGANERLFERPRPANEHNLVLAERFIDGLQGGGGTMLGDAVELALAPNLAAGERRYVVFLTDGYVGDEADILARTAKLVDQAERAGGRARVFGVGIGSSPNRYLIDGLAEASDAAPLYASNREHPRAQVDRLYRYVDHPVLDQLSFDWAGLAVDEVYGADASLFASRALVVVGRYRGQLRGDPKLVARIAGTREAVELPITVVPAAHDDRVLATLWARERIAELTASAWDGDLSPSLAEAAITEIGLEHHLVTAYTSLVAVDRSRSVGDGAPIMIEQPVELPEDLDAAMAGAPIYLAPTASGDAGYISLAGTTGAESKYTVEGAEITNPAFGNVPARIPGEDEFDPHFKPSPVSGAHWDRHAKLKIRELLGSAGVDERAFERALERRAGMFEACYEQRVGERGELTLRYRLSFDADGRLTRIELLSNSSTGAAAQGCIEAVLRRLAWAGLPDGDSSVELELRLRMR